MEDGTDYGGDISPCNNDREMINGEAGVCDADHCVNMIMVAMSLHCDQDMSPSMSQPFIAILVSWFNHDTNL